MIEDSRCVEIEDCHHIRWKGAFREVFFFLIEGTVRNDSSEEKLELNFQLCKFAHGGESTRSWLTGLFEC